MLYAAGPATSAALTAVRANGQPRVPAERSAVTAPRTQVGLSALNPPQGNRDALALSTQHAFYSCLGFFWGISLFPSFPVTEWFNSSTEAVRYTGSRHEPDFDKPKGTLKTDGSTRDLRAQREEKWIRLLFKRLDSESEYI